MSYKSSKDHIANECMNESFFDKAPAAQKSKKVEIDCCLCYCNKKVWVFDDFPMAPWLLVGTLSKTIEVDCRLC